MIITRVSNVTVSESGDRTFKFRLTRISLPLCLILFIKWGGLPVDAPTYIKRQADIKP
ncbi:MULTISPECIES: hypothetical protein [Planktothrix]|uniref:hypothetical protein n=1 Tax=Planktothrix TaxID=54304 RepID=UPI001645B92C|nr:MULTISPECIES: hypothetical protein [Planktothrix]